VRVVGPGPDFSTGPFCSRCWATKGQNANWKNALLLLDHGTAGKWAFGHFFFFFFTAE
jgi:hypothetical protein